MLPYILFFAPLRVGHEPSSNHGNRFYLAICMPEHVGVKATLKPGFASRVGKMTDYQVVNPAAKSELPGTHAGILIIKTCQLLVRRCVKAVLHAEANVSFCWMNACAMFFVPIAGLKARGCLNVKTFRCWIYELFCFVKMLIFDECFLFMQR